MAAFFSINTRALRQSITPPALLGRVQSFSEVIAWSAIPIGSLLGGWVVGVTGNVTAVYVVLGLGVVVIAAVSSRTPFGHADRYIVATSGRASAQVSV